MITIIVPIHNTSKYLEKCLNSIKKQTYKNIEVLCIDSSNDGSTEIIKKFVSKDSRFILIKDKNTSYGYKVNLGIKKAKGNYIGIVDSDDYICTKMYEEAHEAITKYRLDFVKFDYNMFYTSPTHKKYRAHISTDNCFYNQTFNSKKYPSSIYDSNIAIWSGLYKKKFITSNNISLNETTGASFQDTSFFFQTLVCANKIRYFKGSYYNYRRDNNNSSSSSDKNVYSVIDEFDYIFNKTKGKLNKEQYEAIKCRQLFIYAWNYIRLQKKLADKFEKKARKEIKDIYNSNIYNQIPNRIKKYIEDSNVLNKMIDKTI